MRVFVQLSKSSQAYRIRKKAFGLETFLYDKEQKHFPKQKCGKRSQQINEKVKKNPKILPVDVIGSRFKIYIERNFKLVILSAINVN